MMNLGGKIYILRKKAGYSQEELAERLGVTRQSVSKWEMNLSVPELSSLVMLAKEFDVTTDYLLGTDETDQSCAPASSTSSQPQPDFLNKLSGFLRKMARRYG